MMAAMTGELTVTATSPGYWSVTDGEHDVHGRIVELGRDTYAWELHIPQGLRADPLQRFRTGPAKSLDEALEHIRNEWPTELNDA